MRSDGTEQGAHGKSPSPGDAPPVSPRLPTQPGVRARSEAAAGGRASDRAIDVTERATRTLRREGQDTLPGVAGRLPRPLGLLRPSRRGPPSRGLPLV